MRKIIAALLICVCSVTILTAQSADDWYQNKPIRAISFNGLVNLSKLELDAVFSSYSGKLFTDDLYWEILQKLYALEYFNEIEPLALPGDPDRKTVLLQFTVTERPVIDSIRFIGNRKLKSPEIREKITLKEGDIYNEVKSRMDERAIRDFYLEKGYANIRVSSAVSEGRNGRLNMVFTIDEGKQTVVSSIQFEGNRVMSRRTLLGTLSLKETRLLTSGIFQESALEADKAAIRRYYNDRGYIDAEVENVVREIDTESNPEKNTISLVFIIREGEQYTYGGTSVEGNSIFTTDQLLARIRMREGDVFNKSRFEEGFQAAADLYFENGYTSNYIGRNEVRDDERKRISFTIVVREAGRSHVERIILRGNTKTKDHVIFREIPFESGDIFSKAKLINGIRNLYNTRYFSVVSPDLVPGSEENLVDVIVNVEEQSTASVQFGVTFSGVTDEESFPMSAFVQWADTNFRGLGHSLSANLTASPDTQSLTLGFAENWFLGSPLTVSFDLSVKRENKYAYQDVLYPRFSDDYVPDPFTSIEDYENSSSIDDAFRMKYQMWDLGLGMSTGYRWFPNLATLTLKGGFSFSIVRNFYDASVYRPADPAIRNAHGMWAWNNSIWTKLSFDRRDLYYDPSSGWFASQQVTMYGLFPSIETSYFFRFDTKLEGYVTLLDLPVTDNWNLKFVLAAYTGLSFLQPFTDMPISDSKLLYIDGMFTGYGWTSLSSDSSARGSAQLNHWVELRMPVAPGILTADAFFSAITTKKDLSELSSLKLEDYYFSFGPSMRFSIPQFPLRLIFANTFRLVDGKVEWGNKKGPEMQFVLSFNIANQ